MPLAVFGMGPRTLAVTEMAGSRRRLDKALAAAPEVQPISVAVFGGVVDPAQFRFPFSRMSASDARDWKAVASWSTLVAERLAAVRVPAAPS